MRRQACFRCFYTASLLTDCFRCFYTASLLTDCRLNLPGRFKVHGIRLSQRCRAAGAGTGSARLIGLLGHPQVALGLPQVALGLSG